MESIFAIMVISISITLLLASISTIEYDGGEGEELEREAEAWKERILGLISEDGITVEKKDLNRATNVDRELRVGEGLRAEIQVFGADPSRIPIMALGYVPESVGACYSLSTPINFIDDGPDVMAARLMVVIW